MKVNFNTDGIPAKHASEFFGERLKQAYDYQSVTITPKKDVPFTAKFSSLLLPSNVYFAELESPPCKFQIHTSRASELVGLIFPLVGNEIRTHEKRIHSLVPGQIMLNNPESDEEKFEVTSDERRRRLFVGVPRTLLRNHFPVIDDEKFRGFHILPDDESAQLLSMTAGALSRVANHSEEYPLYKINAMLDSFIAYLTCALHELPIAKDGASRLRLFHMQHIKRFVIDHLSHPLNIKTIAQGVKLSESYIFNLFADEPVTLMKWVWEQRLERCLHDLSSNSAAHRSIREIAFSWGFNDPAHFSHLFHQKFGMAPSHYRNQKVAPQQTSH